MGAAIKEQIQSEREAIVDALYPVIGSTIAKYMSETLSNLVQSINEKLEKSFSFAGMIRRLQGRVQGVSAAELMVRDSISCRARAAFLIHSPSGLVIAQAYSHDAPGLDSELMSGMLTAIRNFFRDSMSDGRTQPELDQIDYGTSKILLEAAGYCYLAVLVEGTPNEPLRSSIRSTVSSILQSGGDSLRNFTGDQGSVQPAIGQSLRDLLARFSEKPLKSRPSRPTAFIAVMALLLLGMLIPLGLSWYETRQDRALESRIRTAFASSPLSEDRVGVRVDGKSVTLAGVLPNDYLRKFAVDLVQGFDTALVIENAIVLSPQPPMDVLVRAEISATAEALNAAGGVRVVPAYAGGSLRVSGQVTDSILVVKVLRAFGRIEGVSSLTNALVVENPLEKRLYFGLGSSSLDHAQLGIVKDVARYLFANPELRVQIVGHADFVGPDPINRRLAERRALTVVRALTSLGIDQARLVEEGSLELPPGSTRDTAPRLLRCVRFAASRDGAGWAH